MSSALMAARTFLFFLKSSGWIIGRDEHDIHHWRGFLEVNSRKGAIFAKRDTAIRGNLAAWLNVIVLVAPNELASRFTRDLGH